MVFNINKQLILESLNSINKIKKIAFINGFAGENSSKADQLNELFKKEKIDNLVQAEHVRITFQTKPDKIITTEADAYFKSNKPDLIIATSFGGYIGRYYAHKYNIPFFGLNPVTELDIIMKVLDYYPKIEERFKNLNNLRLNQKIFLNKDDTLIPNKYAKKNLKGPFVISNNGTHRFRNMQVLIPYIKKILKV